MLSAGSTRRSLAHITKEYFKGELACDINGGDCFIWAYIAKKLYPQAKLYTVPYFGGHAFIKLGTLYYDAEHPRGLKNWKKLKTFQGHKLFDAMAEEQSVQKFKRYWKCSDEVVFFRGKCRRF